MFRGAVTLAVGSGFGRTIGIAAIPILTRLYTPKDFGVLSVFTALVLILAPLITLRYVLALPLPRQDGMAMNLLALVLGLLFSIGAMLAAVMWLWRAPLLALFSMETLANWWWLIVLGVMGAAIYETLTLWATRGRAYKEMAYTQVTQSAAGAVVKIALGLAAIQPLGLLVGQVVAQTGGITRLLRHFWPQFRTNWRYVSAARIRMVASRYKGFAIWRVPSQFLMIFSMQAPVLFMAAFYDAGTTGQFGLAVMALSIPVNVMGQSAGNALYGEAAKIKQTDWHQIPEIAKNLQKRLLILSIPPAAIIFFFGESIFCVLFGRDWAQAGRFASILSVALVFQFTSAPLIKIMNILSNQSVFLVMNAVRFVGVIAVFRIAEMVTFDAAQTIVFYTGFSVVFYLLISLFVLRELGKEVSGHVDNER